MEEKEEAILIEVGNVEVEEVNQEKEEEEKEVENEEDENNIPEKHDEPIDRKEKIYNNQEAKKLIKKNENINKGVIEEIPRIMVLKRPKKKKVI